jgi:hypothetical protein
MKIIILISLLALTLCFIDQVSVTKYDEKENRFVNQLNMATCDLKDNTLTCKSRENQEKEKKEVKMEDITSIKGTGRQSWLKLEIFTTNPEKPMYEIMRYEFFQTEQAIEN